MLLKLFLCLTRTSAVLRTAFQSRWGRVGCKLMVVLEDNSRKSVPCSMFDTSSSYCYYIRRPLGWSISLVVVPRLACAYFFVRNPCCTSFHKSPAALEMVGALVKPTMIRFESINTTTVDLWRLTLWTLFYDNSKTMPRNRTKQTINVGFTQIRSSHLIKRACDHLAYWLTVNLVNTLYMLCSCDWLSFSRHVSYYCMRHYQQLYVTFLLSYCTVAWVILHQYLFTIRESSTAEHNCYCLYCGIKAVCHIRGGGMIDQKLHSTTLQYYSSTHRSMIR